VFSQRFAVTALADISLQFLPFLKQAELYILWVNYYLQKVTFVRR